MKTVWGMSSSHPQCIQNHILGNGISEKYFLPPNVLSLLLSMWLEFLTLNGKMDNERKPILDPTIQYQPAVKL